MSAAKLTELGRELSGKPITAEEKRQKPLVGKERGKTKRQFFKGSVQRCEEGKKDRPKKEPTG